MWRECVRFVKYVKISDISIVVIEREDKDLENISRKSQKIFPKLEKEMTFKTRERDDFQILSI